MSSFSQGSHGVSETPWVPYRIMSQRQGAFRGHVQPRVTLLRQDRPRRGQGSGPLQRRTPGSRTGHLPASAAGEPTGHRDLHRHLLGQATQAQARAGRRAPTGPSRLLPLRSLPWRRGRLCHGPSTASQMEDNLKALYAGPLNEEEMARIRRIGKYIHGKE